MYVLAEMSALVVPRIAKPLLLPPTLPVNLRVVGFKTSICIGTRPSSSVAVSVCMSSTKLQQTLIPWFTLPGRMYRASWNVITRSLVKSALKAADVTIRPEPPMCRLPENQVAGAPMC
ncbi:hypothetical protein D3C79_942120 [compost metagenome]